MKFFHESWWESFLSPTVGFSFDSENVGLKIQLWILWFVYSKSSCESPQHNSLYPNGHPLKDSFFQLGWWSKIRQPKILKGWVTWFHPKITHPFVLKNKIVPNLWPSQPYPFDWSHFQLRGKKICPSQSWALLDASTSEFSSGKNIGERSGHRSVHFLIWDTQWKLVYLPRFTPSNYPNEGK